MEEMQILQEQKSVTAMDGGNADFAGAKICQINALMLTFEHRQDLWELIRVNLDLE